MHTYEAMTVDVTRISDTRKWGRPPQEDSPPAQAATKPGAWTHPGTWVGDWGRPIELFKRLTGRGTKRKREADGENSNGQETEKQDHWQVRGLYRTIGKLFRVITVRNVWLPYFISREHFRMTSVNSGESPRKVVET